jgi:AcrR family transcriptional regulator
MSDPADSPLTRRAEKTRERILDAAAKVFAERGFDAATTREIAALSGTNVATPYNYFDGKEALYTAAIERAVRPLIELMNRFAHERDKPEAAADTIHAVLEQLASHEDTTRLVYREIVSEGLLAQLLTRDLFEPLIGRILAELRANGQVEPAMEPFIASLYVHLSFSHVALAPLLSRVFGRDMLSPESLARQARVIGAAGELGVTGFAEDD